MIQEGKQLLLQDLCARLPYDPIVYVDENLPRIKFSAATRVWEYIAVDKPCKPYLRPMSSMTEKERQEYEKTCFFSNEIGDINTLESYDWLNKKMFDYRGLIPKGLALKAPEGMYKTE